MVIGSRCLGGCESGAMYAVQVIGNTIACLIIRLRFKVGVTDLGPLRAIHVDRLLQLDMSGTRYGWTAEMQVKAYSRGYNVIETPVLVKARRSGESKISGTARGVFFASMDILRAVIFLR